MAIAAAKDITPRWIQTFEAPDTFDDDLGTIGAWVGPRVGRNKRSKGEKEDYVLRRLLVALKAVGELEFPFEIVASNDEAGRPDFVMKLSGARFLGLEITEAGSEDYQKWLTQWDDSESDEFIDLPLEGTEKDTGSQILKAIEGKVRAHDQGKYQGQVDCDLVVYHNTGWGDFQHKQELVDRLACPSALLGRFRQIHLVFDRIVFLDLFSNSRGRADIEGLYEIDYAEWIAEQIERMRRGALNELDLPYILEEFEDLARSERRALGSHFKVLLLHLLKWEYQAEQRSASWRGSISSARDSIDDLLLDSPSLHGQIERQIRRQYHRAADAAARETGLRRSVFPETCPYEISQLLDHEFLPSDREGRTD